MRETGLIARRDVAILHTPDPGPDIGRSGAAQLAALDGRI